MRKNNIALAIASTLLFSTGSIAATNINSNTKSASTYTVSKNDALKSYLNFDDKTDFEAATRGFIATWPQDTITDDDGNVVWDFKSFSFITEVGGIDTINPSLERQAFLNNQHGLFMVKEGVYQVRGFDLSVMSIIRGKTGWIVIDPLLSEPTSKAGISLLMKHVEDLPVTAVIFTHSHIDHFGGIWGVTSEKDITEGKTQIIAPDGFFEHSVSENVLAGSIMSRRAGYMYGNMVSAGPKGKVDGGLGKTTSTGKPGIVKETIEITDTGSVKTIDGIKVDFQMANGSEAPSEFIFYFPEYKALMAAEVMTHSIHNISTLRGARTRDANAWAGYIDETIDLYANKSEVMIGSHHWPTWGKNNIVGQLEKTRDMYKFVHDQTLRLANHGYTLNEISNKLTLPESLDKEWYNRGYYGTVSHNARATYDFYFGAWWNGNPANLNPLAPEVQAAHYVDAMGGEDKVVNIAQTAINKGEYRWAVTLLNNVTFSSPDNMTARYLEADAMEQLGYQAESGPWRNYYLVGAKELREGYKPAPAPDTTAIASNMPVYSALEAMAVRVNPDKANGLDYSINFKVSDDQQGNGQYAIKLSNSVMKTYQAKHFTKPDAIVSFSRNTFVKLVTRQVTLEQLVDSGKIKVSNQDVFSRVMSTLDQFKPGFGIVTP